MTRRIGSRKFKEFIEQHGITKVFAAKVFRVTAAAISGWCNGKIIPSDVHRAAIELWTGGEILANDFLLKKEREDRKRLLETQPYQPEAA